MLKQLLIMFFWIISSIICIPIQEYTLETEETKKFRTIFYAFIRNLLIFTPLALSFLFPSKYLICLSITAVLMLISALTFSTLIKKLISFINKKLTQDVADFTYWFFIILSTYTGFYIGKSDSTCQAINNYSLYIIITVLLLIIIFLIVKKTSERKKEVELHQRYLNKENNLYEENDDDHLNY